MKAGPVRFGASVNFHTTICKKARSLVQAGKQAKVMLILTARAGMDSREDLYAAYKYSRLTWGIHVSHLA